MSNQNQIHRTTGMGMGRRRFMQAVAGTAAAGSMLALDDGPVGQSQAIAPVAAGVLAGAGIAAGGVALGWALREFEVIGADDPAEGLTADALLQDVYETALTRQSTNNSTIIDNQNILSGVENTSYIDGKLAAFEALNAEKTEQEVIDAATAAVDSYASVIKANYLKSWNESVRELVNLYSSLEAHSEIDETHDPWKKPYDNYVFTAMTSTTNSISLPDGTSQDLLDLLVEYEAGGDPASYEYNATQMVNESQPPGDPIYGAGEAVIKFGTSYGEVVYMDLSVWKPIWDEMETKFQDVRDGLTLWVENVYGQVQSGDVEVSDLITPRERAAMMTDDGKFPQAVADLLALNVPVDLEREATVSLDYMSEDVTLRGTLGITSPPDTLESGTQYNPDTDNLGSVYLTYDVGTGEGVWSGYDDSSGVDGGTVTFTTEPLEEVTYRIETNYNETAEVVASDFTEGDDGSGNTIWTVDVSDQLDNSIADISEVTFYTKTDETRYETIQITGNFTIEKFMNQETGEEETEANFTSSEPQSDNNYVTQEEWDELQAQNEELIAKYEESTSGGGGGFLPDFGSLSPLQKAGAAVGIGGGGYLALNSGSDGGGGSN